MKILFIGDLYGKSGRDAAFTYIKSIREKYNIDLVIANGENSAHGSGMVDKSYRDMKSSGIDIITLGNHFLDKEEILPLLRNKTDIVRPLNIAGLYPGYGSRVFEIKGYKVRVTNLLGRVNVKTRGVEMVKNPFTTMDELLDTSNEKIHIVDFHAEATGEKKSLARYLDGRVSAIIGTHTHVQTADNQVLNKGSAYISDVGYCGSYDSVLGIDNKDAISFSKDQNYKAHTPALSNEYEFSGVVIDVDEESGKSISIKRIYITPEHKEIELY